MTRLDQLNQDKLNEYGSFEQTVQTGVSFNLTPQKGAE